MFSSSSMSNVFDHDASRPGHGCPLDPSCDPTPFGCPSEAIPVGGQASLLLVQHRQQSTKRIAAHVPGLCCQIPSRWLSQFFFLQQTR
jgi:hypothetical protein